MIELIRFQNGQAVGAPTGRPRDAHVSFPRPIEERHLPKLAELGWHRVKRQEYNASTHRIASRVWSLVDGEAEEVLTLEPVPDPQTSKTLELKQAENALCTILAKHGATPGMTAGELVAILLAMTTAKGLSAVADAVGALVWLRAVEGRGGSIDTVAYHPELDQ